MTYNILWNSHDIKYTMTIPWHTIYYDIPLTYNILQHFCDIQHTTTFPWYTIYYDIQWHTIYMALPWHTIYYATPMTYNILWHFHDIQYTMTNPPVTYNILWHSHDIQHTITFPWCSTHNFIPLIYDTQSHNASFPLHVACKILQQSCGIRYTMVFLWHMTNYDISLTHSILRRSRDIQQTTTFLWGCDTCHTSTVPWHACCNIPIKYNILRNSQDTRHPTVIPVIRHSSTFLRLETLYRHLLDIGRSTLFVKYTCCDILVTYCIKYTIAIPWYRTYYGIRDKQQTLTFPRHTVYYGLPVTYCLQRYSCEICHMSAFR